MVTKLQELLLQIKNLQTPDDINILLESQLVIKSIEIELKNLSRKCKDKTNEISG